MKKALLFLVFGISLSASAQIKTDAGTFEKPKAKDFLWEINFSPNLGPDLSGEAGLFSLPFLAQGSDIVVLKGRKFLSDNSVLRGLANLSIQNDGNNTDMTFALGAGLEKHSMGRERLSAYWGYGGGFGFKTDNEGSDNSTYTETTVAFSMGLFSGFDYYIMPDVYLGIELNYGFGFNSVTPEGSEAITSIALSPGVTPSFRLGWRLY